MYTANQSCSDHFDERNAPDRPARPSEAMAEYARNIGGDEHHKNSQWILTDFDVWERNPHYSGPPQRHPEEYDPEHD